MDIITKCEKHLLKNASSFSLQNATVLSPNVAVITKYKDFIRKSDSYYKMQCLIQNASVQGLTLQPA